MVHRSPSLSRLVPLALLLVVGSCSHARSRPSLADREAQCAPVWKAVHAEIDSRGAACSADWECREVRPEYLGCDAWANVGYRLSEGRIVELENACAPISFVPDCGPRVGACVEGRCTGRRAAVDKAACPSALAALAARLQKAAACTASSDCSTVGARAPDQGKFEWHPVPADWAVRFAKERAAAEEVCDSVRVNDGTYGLAPKAGCENGACKLAPQGPNVRPGLRKPAELEKGCVGRSVQLPRGFFPHAPSPTLKFRISKRGIPHGFELLPAKEVTPPGFEIRDVSRKATLVALGEAVSQCAFEPALIGDQEIDIHITMPIRFVAR